MSIYIHKFGPFLVSTYRKLYDLGVARGQHPRAKENLVFCELNKHNFRPFLSQFTEMYNIWWLQGAALLCIRECVFGGTI